jgi:serine/threonine protein phosphatase 1
MPEQPNPTPFASSFRAPAGQRLYAVGDVHGRFDLLKALLDQIAQDQKNYDGQSRIIFLGDYLDRGPESRAVIDLLLEGDWERIPMTVLRGNHEDIVLRFLSDASVAAGWRWQRRQRKLGIVLRCFCVCGSAQDPPAEAGP